MKPTDDTIALAAFLHGAEWLSADEIRHAIAKLGFEMPSSQWVAARLTLMTKESSPRFESAERWGPGYKQYRVTAWAANGLENIWDGFTPPRHHSLPRPFPKAEPQSEEE